MFGKEAWQADIERLKQLPGVLEGGLEAIAEGGKKLFGGIKKKASEFDINIKKKRRKKK